MEPITVTGGTGALGRVVVRHLEAAGHRARVVSRRTAPPAGDADREWAVADLAGGRAADDALAGAGVVVHCATAFRRGGEARLVRTVVDAARRTGCRHLVYISIVGVDRVPLGYYRGKLAAERVIEASGLPHTIVRATQFHDLLRTGLAAAAKAPVLLVPDLPFQPVDVRDVAAELVRVATGDPEGRAPDVAGPEVREARDLARSFLSAVGRRRRVLPVRFPGAVFAAYRDGGHLAPGRAVGRITFERYLAERAEPAELSYRGGRP